MVSSSILGYIGATVASIFFGSNYVPVKGYNTGNGISFQWVMCSGILIVGFLSLAITRTFVFDWRAILGGGAWALGNCLSMPTISLVGLGVGLLTWSSTNLVAGYFWGRFGVFGMKPEKIGNQWFSALGVIFAVVALLLFVFIKPDLKDSKEKDEDDDKHSINKDYLPIENGKHHHHHSNINTGDYPEGDEIPWLTQTEFYHSLESIFQSESGGRILGIIMAVISGLFYSVSLVPFKLWTDDHKDAGPLDYCFSQFSGIYVVSTGIFVIYTLIVRPPRINVKATLPSYLSGVLWAVAAGGWMYATSDLGFTVGYPISGVGPLVVTSLWSVLWFREIKGTKNLGLLMAAFLFIALAITFLVLSSS